ncbi:hypothetical protein P692DRAFT_201869293 [Suillus brevipes Sb2]|nr:hypothetical protein P692DRAFT_201869293 [Suillus brevipes Sb2]
MPVVRLPRPRRSARLKGVQTLSRKGARTMEPTQGPITRGRGGKNRGGRGSGTSNPDTASGRLVIQWQADVTRTQRVVEHLRSHPADCPRLHNRTPYWGRGQRTSNSTNPLLNGQLYQQAT